MLTFFTIPKPFEGHIGIIQSNAIQSWMLLEPQCEVILFGDEPGIGDTARELGAGHVPEVERNEYGTPLLSSAFEQAYRMARHSLLCYVNADIVLMSDFVQAVAVAEKRMASFMMVGRRWNVDIDSAWDFSNSCWDTKLGDHVASHGKLHGPSGIDYFVFPRHRALMTLPPFAVGRPAWDNWFIFRARQLRLPVIDATESVMAVHQNHDYGHVPSRRGQTWDGPEGDQNRTFMGGSQHRFTLRDATHHMTANGPKLVLDRRRVRRHWQTLPILRPKLRPWMEALSTIRRYVTR